jgi:hypothetical protein
VSYSLDNPLGVVWFWYYIDPIAGIKFQHAKFQIAVLCRAVVLTGMGAQTHGDLMETK